MFEIKLANGTEASFNTGAELCDWYERMTPKKINTKRKEQIESKQVVSKETNK